MLSRPTAPSTATVPSPSHHTIMRNYVRYKIASSETGQRTWHYAHGTEPAPTIANREAPACNRPGPPCSRLRAFSVRAVRPCFDLPDESIPRRRGEDQDRPERVLAIAYQALGALLCLPGGDLDAVAVGEAERRLDPSRAPEHDSSEHVGEFARPGWCVTPGDRNY